MRSLTGRLSAVLLAALLLLTGCGEPPKKGPPLPYTPAKPFKETDIVLKDDLPRVLIKTSQGDVEAILFEDEAPNTVANFVQLAEKKFYDGLTFHRIMANFCIQGGDPNGDGLGGPGYRFKDEFGPLWHRNLYGSLAMANSGPDTNGSQFFFNVCKNTEGNLHLDQRHVVFGKVVKGLEVLDKLAAVETFKDPQMEGRPKTEQKIISITVLKKRDHPYEVKDTRPDFSSPPRPKANEATKEEPKKDQPPADAGKKDEGKKDAAPKAETKKDAPK